MVWVEYALKFPSATLPPHSALYGLELNMLKKLWVIFPSWSSTLNGACSGMCLSLNCSLGTQNETALHSSKRNFFGRNSKLSFLATENKSFSILLFLGPVYFCLHTNNVWIHCIWGHSTQSPCFHGESLENGKTESLLCENGIYLWKGNMSKREKGEWHIREWALGVSTDFEGWSLKWSSTWSLDTHDR